MGRVNLDEESRASEYQKWDYIASLPTLSDFRTASFGKVMSYAWLWFLVFVAVAVYAADSFTAINLLVFNKWSSEIQPAIPISISKWIFAGCIILSWILCIYEWIRAVSAIRRGNVAESYLDPLAVTLQSIRITPKGQGWRRFLVFAALTKSKKGADYTALFTYFQFKGAIRILLAEGPRQAINALTLYSVMKAKVFTVSHDGHSNIEQFWINVKGLADQNEEQATIIFTMLFTLVIWVFSFLSFLIACILYVSFLHAYIPKEDGSLSKYCRRKVDKRLSRIVNVKAQKAMRKDEAKRQKEEERALKKDPLAFPQPARAPTLPVLKDDDSDYFPLNRPLSRSTSQSTLPPYSSRSQLGRNDSFNTIMQEPKLPQLDDEDERMREPTLPRLANDAPNFPFPLTRTNTEPTLPHLDNEPPSFPFPLTRTDTGMSAQRRGPTLQRGIPVRSGTTSTVNSSRPLLHHAGSMGYSDRSSPEEVPVSQAINFPFPAVDPEAAPSGPLPNPPLPGQLRRAQTDLADYNGSQRPMNHPLPPEPIPIRSRSIASGAPGPRQPFSDRPPPFRPGTTGPPPFRPGTTGPPPFRSGSAGPTPFRSGTTNPPPIRPGTAGPGFHPHLPPQQSYRPYPGTGMPNPRYQGGPPPPRSASAAAAAPPGPPMQMYPLNRMNPRVQESQAWRVAPPDPYGEHF